GLFFGASPETPEPAAIVHELPPRIDVVFREDVTSGAMAAAIAGIDGEIISGPTARGRYRVALPEDSSADIAAQALADAGIVVYVEPVE
ncbi:MAG: hypothetical protein HKP30_13850, partial [Myxococcales bacterium]|nr:hypothetical protein [Myxococcales bacterium]